MTASRDASVINVGEGRDGWGSIFKRNRVRTHRVVVGAEAGADQIAHGIQVALCCPLRQRLVTRTRAYVEVCERG